MDLGIVQDNNKIQDNADKKISIALMASFVILTIQYFILTYFNLMGTSTGSLIQQLSKVLVGLAYLYALPSVLKRSLNKFFIVYFLSIFIYLLHYAVFPENRLYMIGLFFTLFSMSIPTFIYALSIRDIKMFRFIMKKASYIVFIFGFSLSVLIFLGRASIGSYSMPLSYYLLLPTVIFLDDLMDKFSFKMLILTLLSILTIVSLGARGPILCIIIFFLLKFLKPNTKITYKRAIGHFSLFSLIVIIFVFLEQFIMFLYNLLLKFGINSRTLRLFFYDGVELSGRDRILENVISAIFQSPLIGVGIVGDRRILGGTYVHNFFVEVIANFGIILGGILSIAVILLIAKYLLTKNRDKYSLAIIWLSLGFVHLMVSSSYLIDIRFWIFIGLLLNPVMRKNKIV